MGTWGVRDVGINLIIPTSMQDNYQIVGFNKLNLFKKYFSQIYTLICFNITEMLLKGYLLISFKICQINID